MSELTGQALQEYISKGGTREHPSSWDLVTIRDLYYRAEQVIEKAKAVTDAGGGKIRFTRPM